MHAPRRSRGLLSPLPGFLAPVGIPVLLACSALLVATAPAAVTAQQPADLILTGGNVYTVDESHPRAQAVAVRDGRVVFVGSSSEAEALRGAGTRVVDLEGKTVIPGMIDSHGHLPGLGTALRTVDLVGTRSYDEIIAHVADRAAEVPEGTWIVGRGWDQNEWADTRFPHHEALSEVVPDHPVILTRVDGHAVFVNAEALEIAGVEAGTPDPSGGRIVRDESGEAIGVFVDRAMDLIRRHVPDENMDEVRKGILLAQRHLNSVGLTGMHDAGVSAEMADLYLEMARAGELTVRNHVMLREDLEGLQPFFERGPRANADGSHFVTLRSVKVSIDGALGSRGAALLEPYADEPGHRGLVLVPRDELQAVADAALEHGFQLNVHAIGDRGNRMVLDVFEEALEKRPTPDHRFRIEHAQILHRHDIPRFAELGVIPSMQAIHQSSDMPWAEPRLGWTRLLGAYAWRSLLNTGVVIPGGSDFPVEPADPLLSFHAAVTRQNADGWPAGGWFPAETMTRDEALRHMTVWGAYASFMEDVTGSLTPGKLADIVVLDRDIMTIPAGEILHADVVMTVVGGEIVYERSAESRQPATEQGGG